MIIPFELIVICSVSILASIYLGEWYIAAIYRISRPNLIEVSQKLYRHYFGVKQ